MTPKEGATEKTVSSVGSSRKDLLQGYIPLVSSPRRLCLLDKLRPIRSGIVSPSPTGMRCDWSRYAHHNNHIAVLEVLVIYYVALHLLVSIESSKTRWLQNVRRSTGPSRPSKGSPLAAGGVYLRHGRLSPIQLSSRPLPNDWRNIEFL